MFRRAHGPAVVALLGAWACTPQAEAPTVVVPPVPPSPASSGPKTPKASRAPAEVKDVLDVEIRANGDLVLGGGPVASDADFQAQVRQAVQRSPDLPAVIRADGSVTYARVIHAMELLRSAGVEHIAFAAGPAGP